MNFDEATVKTARALSRAIAEHGAPNSFSCGELARYSRVGPLLTGKVLRGRMDRLARLTNCTLCLEEIGSHTRVRVVEDHNGAAS